MSTVRFSGAGKILGDLINNRSLVVELSLEICKKDLTIGKMIGKGSYAAVYRIKIPGKKKYVVKKIVHEVNEQISTWRLMEAAGYPKRLLKAYNPNANFKYDGEQIFVVPIFAKDGFIPEGHSMRFKRFPNDIGSQFISVDGPAHLCENSFYSEFYIGAMVGEAYRKGECINFFNVHSMFTCPDPSDKNKYMQMILMDRMDLVWGNGSIIANFCYKKDYSLKRCAFIQLMFAIAFYQDRWQLSHNDLHTNNLFVEYVLKDTIFGGQHLIDKSCYHYHLRAKDNKEACDLYLPAIPIIVKIGDFGLSVKYSKPIVGNMSVVKTGHGNYGDHHPYIPNEFYPSYDSLYAAAAYNDIVNYDLEDHDAFLDQMVCYLGGISSIDHIYKAIRDDDGRPYLLTKTLSNLPSAEDLLRSLPVQSLYGKKPPGDIVTLGIL